MTCSIPSTSKKYLLSYLTRCLKLSLLILPINVYANIESTNDEQDTTSTTTVWATEINSSSVFLGDDQIAIKQADHLSDLLRDTPGVDVGGTHSVNQRINIRGMNETDLQIRLDGASQSANMFHHIGNLTLNADILKSADVQVGANSVVNGGIGGAVSFTTKNAQDLLQADEDFGSRISLNYGSNDYQQASLALYGQLSEKFDAMVYGYIYDRNNFSDGDGTPTFGSDGTIGNALFKIGFAPDSQQRFDLAYDFYKDKGDYNPRPDMGSSANEALSQATVMPTEYIRQTLSLNYLLQKNEELYLTSSLYRNHIDLTRDESGLTIRWPGDRLSENNAKNINTGFNTTAISQVELVNMYHKITYGIDGNEQQSISQYGNAEKTKEKAISGAVFVEDRINITDSLSITPGVRYDYFKRNAVTSTKSFDDISFALAAEYDITDGFTLFANSRQLFKAPQLLETFINYQAVTYLDPNIKAESGLNTEVGFRFEHDLGDGSIATNLTVFRTDIDDYIQKTYNPQNHGYDVENIGDVEYEGFEASILYRIYDFGAQLTYAKSDNWDKTANTPIISRDSARSTDIGDSIGLNLDYDLTSLDVILGWNSRFILEEDNVAQDQPVKPSYDVHNLYAQWLPRQIEGLALTFGIDNIFNEQYASHASRSGTVNRGQLINMTDYEPGRNVKATLAYQF